MFVHGGDLWTAPRAGGEAHRLTRTEEAEEFPKFSPDGKWIAFTRDGSVFVMPSCGGEERRLTWRPGWNQVLGWTPDGRNVLVHSDRLKGSVTSNPHLFLVPEQGGWPNPLPMPRATHGSFSADGQKIAYGPNPEIVLWTPFRHYRGGALGYIAIFCPSAEGEASMRGAQHRQGIRPPALLPHPKQMGIACHRSLQTVRMNQDIPPIGCPSQDQLASTPHARVRRRSSPPREGIINTLPSRVNAIHFPSGENFGNSSASSGPSQAMRFSAPALGAVHRSPPCTNTIASIERSGCSQ